MTISFEKVSLTAQLVAYMRQFSDIPFAGDVAKLLHSREVFEALLLEFSGCWITPDFSIRGEVTQVSEQQREFRRIVSAATDRSMYNNAFDPLDQLKTFLGRVGFKAVVSNPLDDVPEPVSMRVLGLPSSLLAPLRKPSPVGPYSSMTKLVASFNPH